MKEGSLFFDDGRSDGPRPNQGLSEKGETAMPQLRIIHNQNFSGVHSFTDGFVPAPKPKLKSEDDILAHALWLERHGRECEALAFLDRICGKVVHPPG